jgi:hypothetical protein
MRIMLRVLRQYDIIGLVNAAVPRKKSAAMIAVSTTMVVVTDREIIGVA